MTLSLLCVYVWDFTVCVSHMGLDPGTFCSLTGAEKRKGFPDLTYSWEGLSVRKWGGKSRNN